MKKYIMIDTRIRHLHDQMKEYTLEELKEYFANSEEYSNTDRIAEVKDIRELEEFLKEESNGKPVPYGFADIEQMKEAFRQLKGISKERNGEKGRLKMYRGQAGLSQSQLANASGVNLQMIQKYEMGIKDINKAQAITIRKLSKALGCSMEDLLEEE